MQSGGHEPPKPPHLESERDGPYRGRGPLSKEASLLSTGAAAGSLRDRRLN
jgi:hypothetical protein